MPKPKVGFYGITGCAGCLLSVIFNEDEILNIVNAVNVVGFPFIKGKNSEGEMDICFIEGVVVSKDDLNTIKKLRARSKVIVSLGGCASHACIPGYKTQTKESHIDYLKYEKRDQIKDLGQPAPLHKYIKVDYMIPGCPPNREEIKTFIKNMLIGKEFRNYPDPVCRECRLFEAGCLLDDGKVCLGPITAGGCEAVCTKNGYECYGCRGLTNDANFQEFFDLMEEKKIPYAEVKRHMNTFMAIEVTEKLKDTKWAQ